MSKQHKWHKEIKHWADGGEIEYRFVRDNGTYSPYYNFVPNVDNWNEESREYRIKPQPKKPQYLYVYFTGLAEVSLSTLNNLNQYELLGKIKLEVDDD